MRKEINVDKDRRTDNRQHFIRIKYKSFTLPNKAEMNPSVYVHSMWRISNGFLYVTQEKEVDNERKRERVSKPTHKSMYIVPTVNNTNCIGCIQLYYIRIEIARLKFNLSFKTNCLFLRRKLFHSFMYS